jgi:predicted PurR-regulated permease PerM
MLYRVRMADEAAKEQHGGGGSRPVIGWRDLHLWQIQPVRDVLVGLAIVGLFLLGDATSVVTVPLLLAILLAYLFEPVIAWAERKTRFSRPAVVGGLIGGVVLVVVVPVVIGIAVGVTQFAGLLGSTGQRIGMVYESVRAPDDEQLAQKLAEEAGPAWSWIRDRLLESGTQEELQPILKAARERLTEGASEMLGSTASFGADAIGGVLSVVGGVFGFAFGVFLTGFFFFFVSTGWVGVKGFARNLVPDKHEAKIIDLAGKCDEVISGFVRGRLTIAFLQGAVFSVAYFLIGVPAAFIVGPVVAILSIVPYLALVGLPVSVGLLWLEGHTGVRGQWWWVLGAPAVVYFVGQALDDYVWTPVIQGRSTNMDTPTILFATLAGGALFGVFGMLIAIPIAACVKILVVEVVWPAFKDWAEGRSEDPLPIERSGS